MSTTPTDDSSPTTSTSTSTSTTSTEELKKTNSKYYFFKSTPKELAEQYKPKQITAEEANANANANQSTTNNGASIWNTGGTWEEQSANDFAHERMKTLFIDLSIEFENGTAKITETTNVDGEASIVFSRGKKRCTFELNVTLQWEGIVDGEEVSGTIECPDIDYTNISDFDIEVKAKDGTTNVNAVKARNALRKQIPKLMYGKMKIFIEELLQHN